jgi:DNA-directed RNA polymerase subunit omega
MPDRRASLMMPRMEGLLEGVGSKFTLVTLAAMRAREINDYYNQLGEGLGKIVPPQVTSISRKPLSIALEEIDSHKIEAVAKPPEGGEGDADAAVDATEEPGDGPVLSEA